MVKAAWVAMMCLSLAGPARAGGVVSKLGPSAKKPAKPVAQVAQIAQVAEDPSHQGLMLAGSLHNGVASLEPAFSQAGASALPAAGDYRLRFLDRRGRVLGRVSFDLKPCQDLPEGVDYRSFCFVVPYSDALKRDLVAVEFQHLGRRLALLRSRAGRARLVPLTESPVLTRIDPEHVRLVWDAVSHPAVRVWSLDGELLAEARGGTLELATAAVELKLSFSDGVRSFAQRIQMPQ